MKPEPCPCEREAIPCFACTQKAAKERLARLDRAITEYYQDKRSTGQPPPIPR